MSYLLETLSGASAAADPVTPPVKIWAVHRAGWVRRRTDPLPLADYCKRMSKTTSIGLAKTRHRMSLGTVHV
jgi:hypothetical protein